MLDDAKNNNIKIGKEIMDLAESTQQRLTSERNLRFLTT